MIIGLDIGSFVFRVATLSNDQQQTRQVYRKYSAFLNHEVVENLPIELAAKVNYPYDKETNNLKQVFSSPKSLWELLGGLISDMIQEKRVLKKLQKANLVLAIPGSQNHVNFSNLIALRSLIGRKYDFNKIRYIPETVALLAFSLSQSKEKYQTKTNFLVLDFGAELLEAHMLSYASGSERVIQEVAIFSQLDFNTKLLTSFGFYRELFGNIGFESFLKLWHHMHDTGGDSSASFSSEWKRILQFNQRIPVITFQQVAGVRVYHDNLVDLYQKLERQLQTYFRALLKKIRDLDLEVAGINIIVGGGFCQNVMIRTLIEEVINQEFPPEGSNIGFEDNMDAVAIGSSLIGIGSYQYYIYPSNDSQFNLQLFKRKFTIENEEISIIYESYNHLFCSVKKSEGIIPFEVKEIPLNPMGGFIGPDLEITIKLVIGTEEEQSHKYRILKERALNKTLKYCQLYYYFNLHGDICLFLKIDNQVMFLDKTL